VQLSRLGPPPKRDNRRVLEQEDGVGCSSRGDLGRHRALELPGVEVRDRQEVEKPAWASHTRRIDRRIDSPRYPTLGRQVVTRMSLIVLVAGLGLAAAGCAGGGEKKSEESDLSEQAQAACTGKRLSAAPKLPASFPQVEEDKLVYTQQSTQGPTNVVEGYFKGDVKEAHDEFEKELKGVGFDILFNELEDHDSEISWKGEGRTGQVAVREECGDADKTYVHITNRAA
jgi:hypothetical protein